MLKVRRSLTEILLDVTNEEITAVCKDVWNRHRAKGTPHDTTNQLNFRAFAHQGTEFDLIPRLLVTLCRDKAVQFCKYKALKVY